MHAEENRVLSKHGPFQSDCIHKNCITGSDEHQENMEQMALDVSCCLRRASFGGKPLHCYRGIKNSDYIFDDEQSLHTFLSLSEDKKEVYPKTTYKPQHNNLFDHETYI